MSNGNNTGLSIIAERYAKALIDLAENQDKLDEFYSNLLTINITLKQNDELLVFLEHPTISLKDKKDVIEKIFGSLLSKYILNLLKLLLDRNRLFIFPLVQKHYTDILNKKRNISLATVITAIEIDDDTKNKIKTKLENVLNKSIKIESKVDSTIIAGMIIKVGDKVLNGSIKAKLENMKQQLI